MSTNDRSASSLSEWLVQRTAHALGGRPWSRRSFLTRTAVAGSALTLNPLHFALRPVSAFAAVCGTDASCAAGYSVFCCTINNGANFCPEGSFTGGWWKADDSGFCCGGPRYYIDCNADCGSGWTCGCETSSATCDNRLIACNQFRYGQCNQAIACYGPVVCRVVTCTAPWEFDPACTSSSATDDNTVTHTAPCLPGNCPSAIIMRWSDLGGPGSFLGPQVTVEATAPAGGGTWVEFRNGAIYDVAPQGLHFIHGAIWLHYEALGGPRAFLGYPVCDELGTPDRIGRFNHFEKTSSSGQVLDVGSIYWTPELGAWSIHGWIRAKWASLGWERSVVGYPVTDETGSPDGIGRYNRFSKLNSAGRVVDVGSIYWTPELGAWSIHGLIREKWGSLGFETGLLGYPVTDETGSPDGIGRFNHFAKLNSAGQVVDEGSIYWTPLHGAWSIHGLIEVKWAFLGSERGILGYPISDETGAPDGVGRYNIFAKLNSSEGILYEGGIIWSPSTGAFYTYGALWDTYVADGFVTGSLGYPKSDPVRSGSKVVQTFQHGTLTWNTTTGVVTRS
ncbi:MAG: twin-arginine translocation signal domain-containing protein [Acidimicrobiaceae bacterium]|nr:twin-arginine translocation signal domain-containing protein [Acidimicrobiaceae bacterium]